MIDDTKLQSFTMNGCFITCHNDLRYMPNEAKKDDVKTHAYFGNKDIKKSDISTTPRWI